MAAPKGKGRSGGRDGGRAGRPANRPQGPSHKAGRPSSRPSDRPRSQVPTTRQPRPQTRRDVPAADLDLIEGRNAVSEALCAGIPLSHAFVAKPAGEPDARLACLIQRLEQAGTQIEYVPTARLDELSGRGAHQGVIARARPFSYADISDIITASGTGSALVVVLDHVTDEGNFGAIARSAEVVGAAGIVIPKARSVRVGPGAFKTSAGAVAHVPVAQVPNLPAALDQLKEAGFWVGGATEHAEQTAWQAPLEGRVALVMGSEGEGISRLVRERCDFECRLPQRGRIESLNVAQAATVLSYEWMRRTFPEAD